MTVAPLVRRAARPVRRGPCARTSRASASRTARPTCSSAWPRTEPPTRALGRAGREGLPRRQHPRGVRRRRARDDRAGDRDGGAGSRRLLAAAARRLARRSPAACSPGTATTSRRSAGCAASATATLKVAFAITEPDAGTNTHNLSTRAERRNGHYVLTRPEGRSSPGVEDADALFVVARTGGRVQRPRPAVAVHRRRRRARARARAVPDRRIAAPTSSGRCSSTTSRSAPTASWAPSTTACATVFDGLNPERIMTAASGVGLGRRALTQACDYARERKVVERHADRHPPGRSATRSRRARSSSSWPALMTRKACCALRRGRQGRRRGLQHGQVRGGRGGDPLRRPGDPDPRRQRRRRRVRPDRHVVGRAHDAHRSGVSREMILNYVAEHSLGLPRSY